MFKASPHSAVSNFIITATLSLIPALPALAQTAEIPEKVCRCCSLDRFYAPWMKTLKRPELRKNIGNAQLAITTKSEKAQQYFNQGLNCIHGFWEFEAYRYFLAAIEEDPNCAMAYWGVCMSLPGQTPEANDERTQALKKAKELAVNASEHEQHYISSITALIYSGPKEASTALEKVIEKYPNDMNAVGLLAYWNRAGHDAEGKPKLATVRSIKLLEDGLKKHPDNLALIHYYIHTIESGADFIKAEPYLKLLIEKGKDISHLLHMPGHIYFLNGDYPKAVTAFEQCYAVERAYFEREKITPIDQPNYSHNLHFWAKTLAEKGDYAESIKIAKLLVKSITASKRNNPTKSQNIYLAATLESFIHMRFKQYDKASEVISFDKVSKESALYHYLTVLKHYCDIKAELAKKEADWNLFYEKSEAMEEAHTKFEAAAKNESESTRENARARMIIKMYRSATKLWQLNVDHNNIDLSWAEFVLDDEAKHPYMEPPLLPCLMAEEIGDLCLRNAKPKDAIKYYLMALKKRPKSVHLYRLLSIAFKATGDDKKAVEYEALAK